MTKMSTFDQLDPPSPLGDGKVVGNSKKREVEVKAKHRASPYPPGVKVVDGKWIFDPTQSAKPPVKFRRGEDESGFEDYCKDLKRSYQDAKWFRHKYLNGEAPISGGHRAEAVGEAWTPFKVGDKVRWAWGRGGTCGVGEVLGRKQTMAGDWHFKVVFPETAHFTRDDPATIVAEELALVEAAGPKVGDWGMMKDAKDGYEGGLWRGFGKLLQIMDFDCGGLVVKGNGLSDYSTIERNLWKPVKVRRWNGQIFTVLGPAFKGRNPFMTCLSEDGDKFDVTQAWLDWNSEEVS
jgi:hypothetical protein